MLVLIPPQVSFTTLLQAVKLLYDTLQIFLCDYLSIHNTFKTAGSMLYMHLTTYRPNPLEEPETEVLLPRVGAYLIDTLLLFVICALLSSFVLGVVGAYLGATASGQPVDAALSSLLGGASMETALAVGSAVLGLIWAITFVAYFTVMEGTVGQTLGKMLFGLVVVHENGSPCRYREAAVRTLLRAVDSVPALYLLGVASILISDRQQRVGDHVASTVVVRAEESARSTSSASADAPA